MKRKQASSPRPSFDELVHRAREEDPPKLDLRVAVRARLSPSAEGDWTDVLLVLARKRSFRVGLIGSVACMVLLLGAAVWTGFPESRSGDEGTIVRYLESGNPEDLF